MAPSRRPGRAPAARRSRRTAQRSSRRSSQRSSRRSPTYRRVGGTRRSSPRSAGRASRARRRSSPRRRYRSVAPDKTPEQRKEDRNKILGVDQTPPSASSEGSEISGSPGPGTASSADLVSPPQPLPLPEAAKKLVKDPETSPKRMSLPDYVRDILRMTPKNKKKDKTKVTPPTQPPAPQKKKG